MAAGSGSWSIGWAKMFIGQQDRDANNQAFRGLMNFVPA
jgi:hypothetical protein